MEGTRPTMSMDEMNPGEMELGAIRTQQRDSNDPEELRRQHLAMVRKQAYRVCCAQFNDPTVITKNPGGCRITITDSEVGVIFNFRQFWAR